MATKADKDALAKGAKEMKKAAAAAAKAAALEKKNTPPVPIEESKAEIVSLLKNRVTIDNKSLSVKIDKETPIEEYLPIFDYFRDTAEHAGFMLGDVMLFGQKAYGDKYTLAMQQTGRALSTLKAYVGTSLHVPPSIRVPELTFSHHREVAPITDESVQVGLLKDAKKNKWSVGELRKAAAPKLPKKKKKAKENGKAGKISNRKAGKPAPPPYVPTDEENAIADAALETLRNTATEVCTKTFRELALKLSNKLKKQFSSILGEYGDLKFAIDKTTGYDH